MLDDHLQSKIDNENNYKIIFVLSQNIEKNKYINVQSSESAPASCCLLLFFPSS